MLHTVTCMNIISILLLPCLNNRTSFPSSFLFISPSQTFLHGITLFYFHSCVRSYTLQPDFFSVSLTLSHLILSPYSIAFCTPLYSLLLSYSILTTLSFPHSFPPSPSPSSPFASLPFTYPSLTPAPSLAINSHFPHSSPSHHPSLPL